MAIAKQKRPSFESQICNAHPRRYLFDASEDYPVCAARALWLHAMLAHGEQRG